LYISFISSSKENAIPNCFAKLLFKSVRISNSRFNFSVVVKVSSGISGEIAINCAPLS